MRRLVDDRRHWQGHDLVERHRAVPQQPAMLGRDLAGAVLEPPRRIGEDRLEPTAGREHQQVFRGCGCIGHAALMPVLTRLGGVNASALFRRWTDELAGASTGRAP